MALVACQMADPFGVGYRFVRAVEGGYVDDPDDPGGATKWGVTQRTYDEWRDTIARPRRDVRLLEEDECRRLYMSLFWARANCQRLPPGLAVCLFDAAVNHGCGLAVRLLQRAVYAREDGVIGPQTLAAMRVLGQTRALRRFFTIRRRHYIRCALRPRQWKYLRGWINRLRKLKRLRHRLEY